MDHKYKIIQIFVSERSYGPLHKDNVDPEKKGQAFEILVDAVAREMRDYIRKFSTYKGKEHDESTFPQFHDKDHELTLEFKFSILHPDNIDRGK